MLDAAETGGEIHALFRGAPKTAEFGKLRKRLVRETRDAIGRYGMLERGARWLVCLSGGKDSYTLLAVLHELQWRGLLPVDLLACNLDQGQPGFPATVLPDFLNDRGVAHRIEYRDTYSVVMDKVPEGRTMCALCSRLRRGNLYRIAREEGCSAVVLGHHRDDILETFFLNLFHGGQLSAMPPKLRNDDGDLLVLRPLAHGRRGRLRALRARDGLPHHPPATSAVPRTGCSASRSRRCWTIGSGALRGAARRCSPRCGRVRPSKLLDPGLFDFAALSMHAANSRRFFRRRRRDALRLGPMIGAYPVPDPPEAVMTDSRPDETRPDRGRSGHGRRFQSVQAHADAPPPPNPHDARWGERKGRCSFPWPRPWHGSPAMTGRRWPWPSSCRPSSCWGGARPGDDLRSRYTIPLDRPLTRAEGERILEDVLLDCRRDGLSTATLLVRIGSTSISGGDWGRKTSEKTMQQIARRVRTAMRDLDIVFRLGDAEIAVALHPMARADLDVAMMIADRVQTAVSEPISLGGRSVTVSAWIGICTDIMAPDNTGAALLSGAECALQVAARQEDGAARAFTPEMQAEVETEHELTLQVARALETGEIRPWYQAQVDANTGTLTGFEALARWYHPELGVLAPGRFLDAVEASGNAAALGEKMLRDSLEALAEWDRAGIDVPHVGINFSMDELRDPRLSDRVAWEVDRRGVSPDRVSVEILETVTLDSAEEAITRNVRALKAAGFRLDLDDFGTGAAAISHIARFGVHRIKIDRSFIDGIDEEGETRRVVSAILRLATELGIDTLAEGVETDAQAGALARMGCNHLQGYGIAKPMPFDETVAWVRGRARSARRERRRKRIDLANAQTRGNA